MEKQTRFIEQEAYLALREALPEYLKPVLTFGYFTGWRKAEILNLQWNQVNLREGIVRLEPGKTKNSEGRTLYAEPELWELLKHLHKNRRMDSLFVFNFKGEKIGDFRKSWGSACTAAGNPFPTSIHNNYLTHFLFILLFYERSASSYF